MTKQTKQFAISILRRGSYKHWARWKVTSNARLGRNEYFCQKCGVIGPKRNYQLDHIDPVIPVTGWISFDDYIEKLYCDVNGYNLLCKSCHMTKSAYENAQRPLGDRAKNKKIK